jgi:hypothetical protein
VHHLRDRLLDEFGAVEGDAVLQPRREALGEILHGGAGAVHDLHGVGVRVLVEAEGGRGGPVEARPDAVLFGAEFDPRDVADANHRTVRIGAQEDVAELLRLAQAPLRHELQFEGRRLIDRRLAEGARGDLRVLLGDGLGDRAGADAERLHLQGIEPDPHRVALVREIDDAAHALHPPQGLDHLRLGPVRQEQLVVGRPVLRVEDDVAEPLTRALRDLQPLRVHRGRELGLRPVGAGEHLRGGGVEIRADLEGRVHADAAVGVAGRVDVEEVLRAVDLLLQRDRDGLVGLLRAGAGIRRLDVDDRRGDLGKLRNGQRQARDGPDQRDQHGDNAGKHRPIDEAGEHAGS